MSKYDIYHNRLKNEYRAVSFDKERIVYRIGFILMVLMCIIGICTKLPSLFQLIKSLSFESSHLLNILVGVFLILWLIPIMYKGSGFKEEFSLKKQGYAKIGTIEASSKDEAVKIYLEKCGKVE